MKPWLQSVLFLLVLALLAAAWVVHFHTAAVADRLPKWGWIAWSLEKLGEHKTAEAAEEEDPDTTTNDIPVHTALAEVRTVHRYVDGFGTVTPEPARKDQPGGGANLSSPVAGVVAKVACQVGQLVNPGDTLIQMDNRVASAAEQQAAAALAQAKSAFDAYKASQPQQLEISQLTVGKSQAAVEFAERTYERLKTLAAAQGVTGKTVEQAALDLAAAKVDLATNQRQLALLKSGADLQQEQAKFDQATAAHAAAAAQLELLKITSPIKGTVVSVAANPGDAVDTTRVLVQVVALDRLVVDVDVPAEALPEKTDSLAAQVFAPAPPPVAAGSAPITAGAPPDPIMGTVVAVSQQVEVKTGAVMVTISLPADSGLKPGMPVRTRIVTEEHKDAVVVPREAVVADENGDNTIAIVEGTQATHKHVHVGFEEEGFIEIKDDDVPKGTRVVTAGVFGLPAASRIKIVD